MAFESVRTSIGGRLVEIGQATQDVAPEFGQSWDPHEMSGMGKLAGRAGRLMETFGHKIMPPMNNE